MNMTDPMSYGYLFIDIDSEVVNNLASKISYNDLYKPDVKNYGISDPHLTLIYGLLHYVKTSLDDNKFDSNRNVVSYGVYEYTEYSNNLDKGNYKIIVVKDGKTTTEFFTIK